MALFTPQWQFHQHPDFAWLIYAPLVLHITTIRRVMSHSLQSLLLIYFASSTTIQQKDGRLVFNYCHSSQCSSMIFKTNSGHCQLSILNSLCISHLKYIFCINQGVWGRSKSGKFKTMSLWTFVTLPRDLPRAGVMTLSSEGRGRLCSTGPAACSSQDSQANYLEMLIICQSHNHPDGLAALYNTPHQLNGYFVS